MTFPNTPLQDGVEFSAEARVGAVNPIAPSHTDSFAFGANVTALDVLEYGKFVANDTNGAVKKPISGTSAVTDLAGVVAYRNNGVMEEAGLQKGGLYPLVPVLVFGRIFCPVTTGEVMVKGDTVSLNLASGADFNTVRKLPGSPAASDLDISTIATVAKPSADGIVELTINKYIS